MGYLRGAPTQLVMRPANAAPEPTDKSTDDGDTSEVDVSGSNFPDNSKRWRPTMTPVQAEQRAQRLKAKNRRKRYLELHPEYFSDISLELADPLLYDRLIRRFQTASEREAEGRRKGSPGVRAMDEWRVKAKRHALRHPNPNSLFTYRRGPNREILEEDKDDKPLSKEEGKAWWVDEMTQRFLRGDDEDFNYEGVDGNERYNDPEEERDIQDAWFESMESDEDTDGEGNEKMLTGYTGIQDY